MPTPAVFRNFDLFIEDDFIDSAACAHIRNRICAVESESGTIFGDDPADEVVDEKLRKVLCAKVEKETVTWVSGRLQNLKPRLEEHFRLFLSGFERPGFLRYDEGAFYTPHRDSSGEDDALKRRISVVIFLNAPSENPQPDCYGGGLLTFYGLLNQLPLG